MVYSFTHRWSNSNIRLVISKKTCCAIEIIFSAKIMAGGTPATAMAAVGVPPTAS